MDFSKFSVYAGCIYISEASTIPTFASIFMDSVATSTIKCNQYSTCLTNLPSTLMIMAMRSLFKAVTTKIFHA